MLSSRLLPLVTCVALSWLTGCANDDFKSTPPFEKLSDVQTWATSSSAVSVYTHGYKLIAVADGKDAYEDATCPALSDDGTTLTVTGDCVDDVGHDWKGQASVVRDGDDRSLTLDKFEGDDGTFTTHLVSANRHEFEVHLVGGGVTTIDYTGSVRGDYGAQTIWNGNGHVQRQGVISPNGAVDASTLDEVVDNALCAGQPASGSTTLTSGSDTAVITYDGESDCDAKQNAQLSVNGKDRGLIGGISCSLRGAGAGGGSLAALAALVLAVGALRLRRRS